MSVDVIDEAKVEDFYTKLLERIDSGNQAEAIEMLDGLKTEQERLEILSQLALDLEHVGALAMAIDLAIALDLALNLALVRALDLALDLARARARALDLALNLARDLTHAIDLAVDLTIALDRDRDREFDRDRDRAKFLVSALHERQKHPVEKRGVAQITFNLVLEGIETLTADNLSGIVSLYLKAVVDLQRAIASLQNTDFVEPHIRMISQNSPLEIVISGVAGAIDIIMEFIIPWRWKHAQEMAKLAKEEKRLELIRRKSELALLIIDKISPAMSEEVHREYLAKLLPVVSVLVESPLEPKDKDAS